MVRFLGRPLTIFFVVGFLRAARCWKNLCNFDELKGPLGGNKCEWNCLALICQCCTSDKFGFLNELDFESYGQFRPEISCTAPSLRCTLSSAPVNIETDACWFPKKLRPLCDKSLTKLKSDAPPLSANVATPKVLIFELELDNATAAVMFETRHPIQ